jgi:hypothetical protein
VGEAEDGVEADAAEASGGPQAVALGQVLGDGQVRTDNASLMIDRQRIA